MDAEFIILLNNIKNTIFDTLASVIPFIDTLRYFIDPIIKGTPYDIIHINVADDILKLLLCISVNIIIDEFNSGFNGIVIEMLTAFVVAFVVTLLLGGNIQGLMLHGGSAVFGIATTLILYILAITSLAIFGINALRKGVLAFSSFVLEIFVRFVNLVISYSLLLSLITMLEIREVKRVVPSILIIGVFIILYKLLEHFHKKIKKR